MTCAAHLKKVFILTGLLIVHLAVYAQVSYEGQVVNKNTTLAIPGVTVQLLKEKITTSTSDQGYFILISENEIPNDTLVFSSVGYTTYRMPLSSYQRNSLITLQLSSTTLETVDISNRKLKVITLNKFDWADIHEDKYYSTTPFSTRYAFAKLFTAPQDHVILTDIHLGRRDFNTIKIEQGFPLTTSQGNTRFLLHILLVNPATRAPGAVFFTKTVTLTDDALSVRLDLSKDNIVLPSAQFYIAVEWLREPYNELVKLGYAPKVRKITKKRMVLLEDISQYKIIYQPALIGYSARKKAVSWIKTEKHTWIPYKGTEIALSATIKY